VPSDIQRGIKILRKDGVLPFVLRTTAYVRKEASKKYSAFQFSPNVAECHIMSEDWDNLIILDACRYDQFRTFNTIPGTLEARTSLGSATLEFLTENFAGASHPDTVYVTANPMYLYKDRLDLKNVFFDIIDVWKTDWDKMLHTVRPEKMVEATLGAYQKYPNKRIISHFIQPHYPFIGETAEEIGAQTGNEIAYQHAKDDTVEKDGLTVWELLRENRINEDTVWKAYNENLEIVLSHVEELVAGFSEKTVITSDHGNLVGDRIAPFSKPMYGHPYQVFVNELRKVPWLVIEGDTRKRVYAETPQASANTGSEDVAERLANLGYRET